MYEFTPTQYDRLVAAYIAFHLERNRRALNREDARKHASVKALSTKHSPGCAFDRDTRQGHETRLSSYHIDSQPYSHPQTRSFGGVL